MKLVRARVKNFRSVEDSGEIEIPPTTGIDSENVKRLRGAH